MEKQEVTGSLRSLTDMDDFDVADNDPDVRGWSVLGGDRQVIGKVKDLLVDPAQMKVRCLDVELDKDVLKDRRHVLIPIAAARLDESDEKVLSGMSTQEASRLPAYTGNLTTREYDKSYHTAGFKPAPMTSPMPGRSAGSRLTRSAEELKIGKRDVKAGEVSVGKHVETRHVSQPATRTREVVTVERRPIEGQSSDEATIGKGGEIHVPVMEEELVVEKRAVAKEEVVISKAKVNEETTVEADLRTEQFDIKEEGRTSGNQPRRPGGNRGGQ